MPTVLHEAVKSGVLEEVINLLNRDAANLVDAKSFHTDKTPLHLAAELGNEDIVQVLLDAGADTLQRCKYEFCRSLSSVYRKISADALQIAVICGHVAVVRILLVSTMPQKADEIDYSHPLTLAAAYDHLQILQML
jgi:ankyrin repeat protein